MQERWFCIAAGFRHGPMSWNDLRKMVSGGALLPNTLVRRSGDKDIWQPASTVAGLFDDAPQVRENTADSFNFDSRRTEQPSVAEVKDLSRKVRPKTIHPFAWIAVGCVGLTVAALVVTASGPFREKTPTSIAAVPARNSSPNSTEISPGSGPPKSGALGPRSATEVYKNSIESIVVLHAIVPDGELHGSGFILEPGDMIITNAHVIDGASSVRVLTGDGKEAEITSFFDLDELRDIAVLSVPSAICGPRGLRLAVSAPAPGDEVIAIGSPADLDFSVSRGVVSQVRKDPACQRSLIQTDATINHGSSGGPLLNLSGDVVGITTYAVGEGHNLNFAVSFEDIRSAVSNGTKQRRKLSDLPTQKPNSGRAANDQVAEGFEEWEDLKKGMSKNVVFGILGKPTFEFPGDPTETNPVWRCERWIYSYSKLSGYLRFDENDETLIEWRKPRKMKGGLAHVEQPATAPKSATEEQVAAICRNLLHFYGAPQNMPTQSRADYERALISAGLGDTIGTTFSGEATQSLEQPSDMIPRVSIASNALNSVGYDESRHILAVEFHDGSLYEYNDVPADAFRGLMAADSKGRYFDENIRSVYKNVRR